MKKLVLISLFLVTFLLLSAYGGDGNLYGGYYFATNLPGPDTLSFHPEFEWINLGLSGNTPEYGNADSDDGYVEVPIGFSFNYFGNTYDSIFIGTNGYCSFTNPVSASYLATNMSIPQTTSPNNVIALCAMDLQTEFIPSICIYGNDSEGNFVYSVSGWNDYDDDDETWDVQMILYPTGRIKIQYNNVINLGNNSSTMMGDCCIGIENINGTIGHQYRNNGDGGEVQSLMALSYAPSPELLSETGEPIVYQNELDFGYCEINADIDTLYLNINNYSLSSIIIQAAPMISGDNTAFTLFDESIYPFIIPSEGQLIYPITVTHDSTGVRNAIISFSDGLNQYQTSLISYNYQEDNNDVSENSSEINVFEYHTYTAVIAPENDVDWYVFWLTSPGNLTIHTETTNTSSLDLQATLYGPYQNSNQIIDESHLVSVDNNGWSDDYNPLIGEERIEDSGFYYLKIDEENESPGYDKLYSLFIEYWEVSYEVPEPPINLDILLVSQGIQLSWEWGDGMPFIGFGGFNVYRDDQLINESPLMDSLFIDSPNDMETGTVFEYKVTAYSSYLNLESAPCDSVLFQIQTPLFSDDFESYDDFSIEFAPWITIDVDGNNTHSFSNEISYQNEGIPQAFMVFNPSETNPPIDFIEAYKGDKFLISTCSVTSNNENWLITPLINLPDSTTHVSFMARALTTQFGMEQFSIGVSNGSQNISDFELLNGDSPIQVSDTWTCYTFSLDEYAGNQIRIGIVSNATNTMMFMLDSFLVANSEITLNNNEEVITGEQLMLLNNFPNPFNPETNITFFISKTANIQLEIFNIRGQKVMTLLDRDVEKGYHCITWDGKDMNGNNVSSGVYLYRLHSDSYTSSRKMILMK